MKKRPKDRQEAPGAETRKPPDRQPAQEATARAPTGNKAARLILGIAAIAAVFLFPSFLLKLGVLIGGVVAVGSVIIPWAFGRDRTHTVLIGLFISSLALAVGLVLAEFAVRTVLTDLTTTRDNTSYFALRWREKVATNTLGFREREISPTPADSVYRIAVIGDSFTWGQGIQRSDRMTERLQALLEEASLNAEVLNFGRPGAQTVDHIRTLRDIVLPLQPDFVLMQWYVNDVEGHDKAGRPTPMRLLPSEAATRWLHRHSALYFLVDQRWQTLQGALGLGANHEAYMHGRFADPNSPNMMAAEAALKEFISIAKRAGVGVGIVAFPNLELVTSPAEFFMGYLIDRLMAICATEGIACVDLREVFAGVSDTDRWWVNKFDAHPGPRANAVAAEAVAAHFRTRWLAAADGR